MLLYLAGMQSIDDEIFESTRIEGISKWQEIRFIVWPMLKGTHLTLILLGVIGALQTFDLVYTLTNGGPNNASQMLSTYIFLRSFRLQSMGYGSAMSVFTLVLALGLSLFQIKVLGAKFQVVE
jgi:multiple sugar transport system permease protein/raffinose/stachyose/melibiose transport system permease protein